LLKLIVECNKAISVGHNKFTYLVR